MEKTHLIVIGFSQLVTSKYLSCIKEAIERGDIDGYSVIDFEPQKETIERRRKGIELQPENIFYVPDRRSRGVWADKKDFVPIFEQVIKEKGKIKVYIASEAKAHNEYLQYCIENDIDSLTEKPVIAPTKYGHFDPEEITPFMEYLASEASKSHAKHSVTTMSRYHSIYNDIVLKELREKVIALGAPVTSFHFRTASGVWNLHREYSEREDHPYKYGYGMLMHGAYHYIDLLTQFLNLNAEIFPDDKFTLTLSSYGAYPIDQNDRIPRKFSEQFEDYIPDWKPEFPYGETDSTTTFCLKNNRTGKVLTLGTLVLEQTTPTIRSWKELSPDEYNKNGRVSSTNFEVQLSTIHSVAVECYDVPLKADHGVSDKITGFARINTRTNASLLPDEEYTTEKTITNLLQSNSNRKLISEWLQGKEEKSTIESHVLPMKVLQAVAVSLKKPGYPVTMEYEFS